MQDKNKTNSKGQKHGYWEKYHTNGQLAFKCYHINSILHGYDETYYSDGGLICKIYYAR